MKHKFLLWVLVALSVPAHAQQLEWTRRLQGTGTAAYNYLSGRMMSSSGDFIVLNGLRSFSTSLKLQPPGNAIITSRNAINPLYFVVLDKSGNFVKSQVINLAGYEANRYGQISSRQVTYDRINHRNYMGINIDCDSISFGTNEPWIDVTNQRSHSFIAVYDSTFDYVKHLTLTTSLLASNVQNYNGTNILHDITVDNQGNLYCYFRFHDTVFLDGTYLTHTTGPFGTSYALIKLNSNLEVQWVTQSALAIGSFLYNSEQNVMYAYIGSVGLSDTTHYTDKDTIWTPPPTGKSACICTIDLETGHIIPRIEIHQNANFINGNFYNSLKANNNVLLTAFSFVNASVPIELTINGNTYTYPQNTQGSNAFVASFNTSDFSLRHINSFDSTSYDLSLSNIYSDSLYVVIGQTAGNTNFGFNGQNVYLKDYNKGRPANYPYQTNFLAVYTLNNNLKNVWFMNTDKVPEIGSFRNGAVNVIDKDIYLCAVFQQTAKVGLGPDTKSLTDGNNSMSLVKYNCLPTAYFEALDQNVNFRNLSSGYCDYVWNFGDGSDTSQQKNPFHPFAKGIQTIKLYVSNDCGTDSFERQINVSTNSVKETANTQGVSIYPNPAQSELYIDIDKSTYTWNAPTLKVRDMPGKTITCYTYQKSDGSFVIDTRNMANGVYLLTISDSGLSKSIRFVVNK